MQRITIPKSDYGFDIDFTVQDSSGSAYDLTGYTVTLKVWSPGVPGTLLIDDSCTIDDASSGTCHYSVSSGDFDTVGIYHGELELTQAGIVESTEVFGITVSESG